MSVPSRGMARNALGRKFPHAAVTARSGSNRSSASRNAGSFASRGTARAPRGRRAAARTPPPGRGEGRTCSAAAARAPGLAHHRVHFPRAVGLVRGVQKSVQRRCRDVGGPEEHHPVLSWRRRRWATRRPRRPRTDASRGRRGDGRDAARSGRHWKKWRRILRRPPIRQPRGTRGAARAASPRRRTRSSPSRGSARGFAGVAPRVSAEGVRAKCEANS